MRRYNILEGDHALWAGVSEPYKHTIRAFLVHFHTLVLRQPLARFSFENGSVGAAHTQQTQGAVWASPCACR